VARGGDLNPGHVEKYLAKSFSNTAESQKGTELLQGTIGDYGNSGDPEQLFVSKVENLISAEHTAWVTIQKAPASPPKA
jgi:hypothetical protein